MSDAPTPSPTALPEEVWQPVEFSCPHCGAAARVSQIQGDRCPGCYFEFKRFGPGEARTREDYFVTLTRRKFQLDLGPDGFIVAHE